MKSKPCSPESSSRRAIFSAAADISAFSIKRKTVDGPPASCFLSTSKWRLARTVPFQQAMALVASRPATNACAFTTYRLRSTDGQTSVMSWSIKARLAARATSGGAASARRACSASSSVWTIDTPSPPEVAFALRTTGKPIRVIDALRSSVFLTTSLFGTRIPSCSASSIVVVLAYTIGKLAGAPSERSMSEHVGAPAFPRRSSRWWSSCRWRVATSSKGRTRSGFVVAIAPAIDTSGAKPW